MTEEQRANLRKLADCLYNEGKIKDYNPIIWDRMDWDVIWWITDHVWSHLDPGPKAQAQRIYYFLNHGLPENWRDQMAGKAPLCYQNEGPEQ